MIGSKNYVVVALLAFHLASAANASDGPMKPLDAVITELIKEKDATKLAYVLKRCSAFSTGIAALMYSAGPQAGKNMAEMWANQMTQMLQFAVITEMSVDEQRNGKKTKTESEQIQSATSAIKDMTDIYTARMKANYVRTGNYLVDDPWLSREMEICKDPFKLIQF